MSRLYATSQEFRDHPTGLNTTNLVAGGSSADQEAALQAIVQEAASYVERITFQPLYARQMTVTRQVAIDPYGRIFVRTPQFPLVSLTSAYYKAMSTETWQSIPTSGLTVLNGDGKHAWFADDRWYGPSGWGRRPTLVQYTAVLGYANALLATDAAIGATTLSLDDITGIQIGDTMTIFDGSSREDAAVDTVASVGDPTQRNGVQQQPGTVTLAAPTAYTHSAGVRVSELPEAVTLATILMAAYLIKERRAGGSIQMGGKVQPQNAKESMDLQMARELLAPFARIV